MKWNQVLRPTRPLEDSEIESDEEIVKLKQKIRVTTSVFVTSLAMK